MFKQRHAIRTPARTATAAATIATVIVGFAMLIQLVVALTLSAPSQVPGLLDVDFTDDDLTVQLGFNLAATLVLWLIVTAAIALTAVISTKKSTSRNDAE